MDIIELAIKRKAKWISKAHITYDSHLNMCAHVCVCVYVLIFLCIRPRKRKKQQYK